MIVSILSGADYADVSALLAAADGPTLFVVPPDWLPDVLAALTNAQDVVADTASTALVRHRHERLVQLGRDRLTGLWSRQPFLASLADWPPAEPARPVRSLLLLDPDRFKAVNDEHGHVRGDQVLREIAGRVLDAVPPHAVCARIGGEEFAVLVPLGHDDARALAESLHHVVRSSPCAGGLSMTVSVGVATGGRGLDSEGLMRLAEGAVYAGKAAGRDRVVHASDVEREALEKEVDPAIQGFENMTRVIADRVGDMLARRGRAIFEQLQAQAEIDALTGLYTRRYLDRRLPVEVQNQEEEPLSVALIDIDHFGAVNKEHGWTTGDAVLAGVAAVLVGAVRETDWVARYGGEEFLVCLPGAGLSEAHTVLERIRLRVSRRSYEPVEGAALRVTVSAGVIERREDETVTSLKERVSRKLLEAKRGGRNRVES